MIIHVDHQYRIIYGIEGVLSAKRGDSLELKLVFYNEKGKSIPPDFNQITFGAKETGDYSGDYLVFSDQFLPGVLENGQSCLSAVIQLNTVPLSTLIGEGVSVSLDAEFEFCRPGWKASSPGFTLFIENDLIKGTEGLPAGVMPDYATKGYVDESVSRKVEDAVGEKLNDMEDAASRAAEAAEASQTSASSAAAQASLAEANKEAAGEFAESAARFSDLSRSWAEGSPVEGSSAKYWAAQSGTHAADSEASALRAEAAAEQSEVVSHNASPSAHLALFDKKAEKTALDEVRKLAEQAGNMAVHESDALAHAALFALKANRSEIPQDIVSEQRINELFSASFVLNACWQKLSSGMIIQYGAIPAEENRVYEVSYPISFPSRCVVFLPSLVCHVGNAYVVTSDLDYNDVARSTVRLANTNAATNCIVWVAIGH